MPSYIVAFAALLACVAAAPAAVKPIEERTSLPEVTFDDATYRAYEYDSDYDIYTFKNIRFAAAPVGDLRWAKPAPPPKQSGVQDGSYGYQCPNAQVNGLNFLGSVADTGIGHDIDDFINKFAHAFENQAGNEDCLFLDVYVPGQAIRDPSQKLPVMNWFYGGGYLVGGKNYLMPLIPLYDGKGLVRQSGNNVIFVGSNYRMGAFGFLAGTTMEEQGTPNAGLWDQRAALQWTKDNIAKLGGNPDDITAYGESAGASSLLHHLVFEGGTMDPLFRKAIFQSPAYIPLFDRKGTMEQVFKNFTQLAGCSEPTVACLRQADSDTLIQANFDLNANAPVGTFVVGPSPDGSLIRQTPTLEYVTGNYWKDLDSAIISHTADESALFVDGTISNDQDLVQFLDKLFPKYVEDHGLDQAVLNFYPSPDAPNSPYSDEGARVRALVRDSSMTCHARVLTKAYQGKTWNMQFSLFPGWHATDILVSFWNSHFGDGLIGRFINTFVGNMPGVAAVYQSYFTSLVRSGDPNTYPADETNPSPINWPHPGSLDDEYISNVLDVNNQYSLVTDTQNPKDACEFWQNFLAAATIEGGYAAPGAEVPSPLLNITSNSTDSSQRKRSLWLK